MNGEDRNHDSSSPQQEGWSQGDQHPSDAQVYPPVSGYQQQPWMMSDHQFWQAYNAYNAYNNAYNAYNAAWGIAPQPVYNPYGLGLVPPPASGPWNQAVPAPLNPLAGFRPNDPGQTTQAAPTTSKDKSKGNGTTKVKKHDHAKIPMPAPKPTHDYLAQALEEHYVVDPPQRMLVILDLNGTLLYRPNRRKPTHMIARPFLDLFLSYLFNNFSVMVWSSAQPENVNALVNNALSTELRNKLVACWGRNSFRLAPEHYSQNVQVYKHLKLIWEDDTVQRHHPQYSSGGRFDQQNTILIDDTSLKAAAQPYNLVEIPEFKGNDEPDPNPGVLREVAGYLEILRMQHDVSRFIKAQPFQDDGRWQYEWEDNMAGGGVMSPQSA